MTPHSDTPPVAQRADQRETTKSQTKRLRSQKSRGTHDKGGRRASPVEVYEVEPGSGDGMLKHKSGRPLALLPSDAPLPEAGDLIVLPRCGTPNDEEERPLVGCDVLTPFRVLGREHLYVPTRQPTPSGNRPQPTRYLTSWIFVERAGGTR